MVQGWLDSLECYAREQLYIVDKAHAVVPLRLNPMQRELHAKLEEQRKHTGKVRAIILKARQLGASTYIAARFFHKLHLHPHGERAFVLAHDQPTAHLLGRMVGSFYDHLAPDFRRPSLKANDSQRMWDNGSSYEVRTASTPSGGRGGTVTLYHSSEVAFQEHAEAHILGSAQQVGDTAGTEMIYESTAAGPLGPFFEMWRSAETGRRPDLMPLFFPWTLDPAYARTPPAGFVLSQDKPNEHVPCEAEYHEVHGCTLEQMAWRRAKIEEMSSVGGDGAMRFSQEYPITAAEAFGGVAMDTLFDPRIVDMCLSRPTFIGYEESQHPLIVGVDPAPSHGESATAIVWRRGRIAYRIERLRGLDPEQQALRLVEILESEDVARMAIDESEGVGHHLVTHLQRIAAAAGKVIGVKFGGNADDRSRYFNKKAEMAARCGQWMARDAAIVDEISLDLRKSLRAELLSIKRDWTQEKVLRLVSKRWMQTHGVPSPDGAEALFLTFALPDPAKGSTGFVVAQGTYGTMPGSKLPRAINQVGGSYVARMGRL